ncbi:tyrosine-type recombinase/integrase [Candidatus Thiodiazotropha sp. CDECU1]|uniref:tyrosine-type recombinase/integrase n=1 Tax=Candidatus Thiodiazotropha sp. CDECU1 TaxID=3065865 RepID=UPI0029306D40|nr:tyrosine-type recombinase/integrase [Candidatus Thiodiazotropha sp. CDECU1]
MKQQPANIECANNRRIPWNKGRIIGQKPPLKPQDIWSIRILLKMKKRYRDIALFNLAIDSKLRACDLVKLKTSDVVHGENVLSRASILQQKTGQQVRFEITDQTRVAVQQWITTANLRGDTWLFASRVRPEAHITTRQYARIVKALVAMIGLDPSIYGTHSIRRTKASIIYKRTKNLRAVQLLLGHTKLESTVRYLGVEVDDALEMAEHTEI